MPKENVDTSPAPAPASHIILESDCGNWLAGKVLRNSADVLAAIEREGAKYRAATPREIAIAGIA